MALQLAPIVDIAGTIQKDSALNMAAQETMFNQGQVKRANAKEDAIQAQIPALLQSYKQGNQGALAEMAGLGAEGQNMAKTLMAMEEHQQQGALRGMQMQNSRLAMMRAQAAIKKEQVEQDLKAIGGLQDALKGVDSPEEKTKIKKLYMQNYERMGGKVPDLLKGDWEPEMDKDLEHLAAISKGLLQRDTEPFTLSKDQVRYGSDGKVIASNVKESAGGADFETEQKLRKEFSGENSKFSEIARAKAQIDAVANDPSAAGDIATVFSFMKMLDPGSTVREGEYATAQNAAGIPDIVRAKWNKLQDGEALAPAQRADFLKQAKKIYNAAATGYNASAERYRGLAGDYKLSPDRIAKPATLEEIVDAADGRAPSQADLMEKAKAELEKRSGKK